MTQTTKLSGQKTIVRRIPAADLGTSRDLIVEIRADKGITLRGLWRKREFRISWRGLAQCAPIPPEMPSEYLSRKLDWLLED